MAAHRNSGRLVLLATVLCLMAAAAFGGYALAGNRAPQELNLTGAASASGQGMTVYACLASGKLTRVSVTAPPKCPASSVLIHWAAQSGGTSSAGPLSDPSSSPGRPPSSKSAGRSSSGSATSASSSARQGSSGTACVSTADNGTCGPYDYPGISASGGDNTNVIQDVWNPVRGTSQRLTAYNPGDWSVLADIPASNTAVVSYPDVQQLYTTTSDTPEPLSAFRSITSSFAENGPGSGRGDDYEAAYDIWAGTGSNNYAQEIMIWVDNHGQTPAGSKVATATIRGATYSVWSAGKNPVSLVLSSNEGSGTINILAALNWLESNGYMPSGSGLNQIDFGWEICSTGGVAKTFTMRQYGLESSCASGSSCTG